MKKTIIVCPILFLMIYVSYYYAEQALVATRTLKFIILFYALPLVLFSAAVLLLFTVFNKQRKILISTVSISYFLYFFLYLHHAWVFDKIKNSGGAILLELNMDDLQISLVSQFSAIEQIVTVILLAASVQFILIHYYTRRKLNEQENEKANKQ